MPGPSRDALRSCPVAGRKAASPGVHRQAMEEGAG
jgi:hypothetical protein